MDSNSHRIQSEDTLIVRSYDDKSSYILQVKGEKKVGRSRVSLKEIVGQPYGAVFELHNRKFYRVADDAQIQHELNETDTTQEVNVSDEAVQSALAASDAEIMQIINEVNAKNDAKQRGDNSGYVDTNTAQKLTVDDIKRLKDEGTTGSEIIKSLIQNSETFSKKTDYAQAKWLKRKQKKYNQKYTMIRSTPASICEASYCKNREKICSMRVDTLAQVLSQSGVHAGTRVLVVESMTGMLVGSLAYRMRGKGLILAVYGAQQPHLDMVNYYNLDAQSTSIIHPIPAVQLGPAAKDVCANGFLQYDGPVSVDASLVPPTAEVTDEPNVDVEATEEENQKLDSTSNDAAAVEDESDVDSDNSGAKDNDFLDDVPAPVEQPLEQRKAAKNRRKNAQKHSKKRNREEKTLVDRLNSTGRTKEEQVILNRYLRQGVDRLIIASKYRPLPILKQALCLLAPSSPFVVFHEFLEPLIDCYLYLQEAQIALRMVLSDTWLREYQTLPGRVRPDMFMASTGGFLLSGIYVGMVPCQYPCAAEHGNEQVNASNGSVPLQSNN